MTAALELLPELQAAIAAAEAATARLRTQLALVITQARSEGLSALPASVRRLACERRQANAVRGDRSQDDRSVLSAIPASVRHREWRRRQAAAKKAAIDPDRSPPLEVQPVITGEATAGGALRADRIPTGTHGPLAGDVASLVGRVTGYAESNPKRDRVWLYEEARRIWNEDLGLHLPSQWTGPKDWGACRALIRDYDREVLLKAVLDGGRAWKQAPGKWSRPTLGLVLHRLRLDSAAAPPTVPKPDSRRLTGEQLEERDRARARAAAPPAKPAVAPPVVMTKAAAEIPSNSTTRSTSSPAPAIWLGEKPPPGEVRPAKEQIALILAELEQRRGGGP